MHWESNDENFLHYYNLNVNVFSIRIHILHVFTLNWKFKNTLKIFFKSFVYKKEKKNK